MPIVPTYQRQTQSPLSPINTHGLRLPQQNAFSSLAETGNHLLAQGMQEYEKHALAEAQENALDFEQYAQSLAHDPQTGLFTKQGKAALGQSQIYADRLDEKRHEVLSLVPAGYARDQLEQQLQRQTQRHTAQWQQYEIGQKNVFQHQKYQATLQNEAVRAENPGDFIDAAKRAQQAILEFGHIHGHSQEAITAQWQGWLSNAANASYATWSAHRAAHGASDNINALKNTPFFAALSTKQQALAEKSMRQLDDFHREARLIQLQQRINDDEARVEIGLPIPHPVTPQEWQQLMPQNATPKQKMMMAKTFERYQTTLALQPVYQKITEGTPEEGIEALSALQPQKDDTDIGFKYQQYAQAMVKYHQVQKAREEDPGAWLTQHSVVVKAAAAKSHEAWADAIAAEKQRLGIRSPAIFPRTTVETLLDQIDNHQEHSVAVIQTAAQQYGRYAPVLLSQLQTKAAGALRVVMATDNQNAANALFQNRHVSTNELKNIAGEEAKRIDVVWSRVFADFGSTLLLQRDGFYTYNDFNEQGKRLAYIYQAQGRSDPAKTAFNTLLGERYTVRDTWRIPNALHLDADDIADGAEKFLKNMKPEQINAQAFFPRYEGMSDDKSMTQKAALQRIKRVAQWITNEDETGLYLTADHTYINEAEGTKPVFVSFRELAALGASQHSMKYAPRPPGIDEPEKESDMTPLHRALYGEERGIETRKGNPLRDALKHRGKQ